MTPPDKEEEACHFCMPIEKPAYWRVTSHWRRSEAALSIGILERETLTQRHKRAALFTNYRNFQATGRWLGGGGEGTL